MDRRLLERATVARFAAGWRGRPVVVVGNAVLDEWHFAEPQRLHREAPVPVVALRDRQDAGGAAANTAVNLAALGAEPVLVAPLGDDAAGERLRACLAAAGVGDGTVTVAGWPTQVKRRLVAGGQLVCCEEEGQPGPLPTGAVGALLDRLTELTASRPAPVLAACDYGLDDRVRRWLVANRARFDLVAVDAQDLRAWGELSPSVVTPSWAEATALIPDVLAEGTDRAESVAAHAGELLARTGAGVAAVTLDGAGSVVVGRTGESWRTGAERAPAGWTVGAGDVYLAALTLALAAAAPVTVAAAIAQRAAAATVHATGTCVCHLDDLIAAADPGGARVVDGAELPALARGHRDRGERVVFTNGCFDVLHRGHVGYLAKARELGDVLVVAVNSDASVRRLKGPERPVNPVEDRVAVLAALSSVDYVVVFEADSPAALIEAVRPDVYVKGGDYPPELVPEAPLVQRLGGDVRVLDYIPDRSTSALIERIRSRATATDGRG